MHEQQTPERQSGALLPPLLEIWLFGPMEVRVSGRPLPRLRSRKGLWLVALLALRRGAPVDRDWLASTLWPDDTPDNARRSLRQSLHDLRRALGGAAERLQSTGRDAVTLDLLDAELDVAVFDAAMRSADPSALAAGIARRRGPLLEGCAEEWVAPERQARDHAYVAGLETLAAAARKRSDHAAAVDWLRRAVTEEPFREDLRRRLMEALDALGDGVGALAAYREYRDLLWSEMAAQPEPQTTELYGRIRNDLRSRATASAASSPAAARNPKQRRDNLPVPLTALIGREEAASEVVDLLASVRLVTLAGPGGIGKTRLAIEAARQAADRYADGVRFVDLVGVTDANAVEAAIREAVGVPHGAGRPGRGDGDSNLADFLGALSILIVLDNCEHLLSACARIAAALLGRCPDVRILATSRRALGIRGETIYRVQPLALPTPSGRADTLGRLDPVRDALAYPAVRLFVDRACAGDRGFRLSSDIVEAVIDICRRLDGIPLAIELASARVRSLPVSVLRDRLQTGFALLADSTTESIPRQQTLAATFQWSWKLLSVAEQAVLRRLSVFAGGWTLEAAEAVTGDVDCLTSLVDASLVVFVPRRPGAEGADLTESTDRYYLLETIRQFAAERLQAAGDTDAAHRRHRDYFLAWVEEARRAAEPSNRPGYFARVRLEHDNLRAALDWTARAGDPDALLRLALALATFWDTCGYLREGRTWLDTALGMATRETPPNLVAGALGYVGWIAYLQGDPAAPRYLRQALDGLCSPAPHELPRLLNMTAVAEESVGNFDAARDLFHKALDIARAAEPPTPTAYMLDNLGCLELMLGNLDAARTHIEACIAQCEHDGSGAQTYGNGMLDLAIVDFRQGRIEEAERHGVESLRRFKGCGFAVGEPDAVCVLGLAARAREDWVYCAQLLGAAHQMRADTGASTSKLIATDVEAAAEDARRALGDARYEEAYQAGRGQSVDDILARVCI